MSLSYNVNQLMAEIASRPILWDRSNEFFTNRNMTLDAWLDVARNVAPNFETLKYEKQKTYVQQIRATYYHIRASYRVSLRKGESIPPEAQFPFLNKVFSNESAVSAPNGRTSGVAVDSNAVSRRNRNSSLSRDAGADANDGVSLAGHLTPVLSIRKIDAAPVRQPSRKRGRPKRHSPQSESTKSPPAPAPIVEAQTPSVAGDPTNDEGDAKRCKYRYEVEMAATEKSAPLRPTSTFASFSFEDEDPSAERRMVPAHGYDPCDRAHAYDAFDRQRNYDVYLGRGEPGRSYSPPLSPMRRHEYFGARRSSTMPLATVPLDYHDDDMAFFRSLLTWTKRFNDDEKLEFRSEVMKLVARMRNVESAANYYVLSQAPLS